MEALRLILRAELRRRRPTLMLALLLGLSPPAFYRALGALPQVASMSRASYYKTLRGAAVAGVALLIGVPLGLLAGRWAWAWLAGSAGVAPDASIPVALMLPAIPVTIALAALIAAWPGRAAARVRAAVLRAG